MSDLISWEITQFLRDGIILQMGRPSPFMEHDPKIWWEYQQLKNWQLKNSIKLHRKYFPRPNPLPLP